MKSTKDQKKANDERKIFRQFAEALHWPSSPDLIHTIKIESNERSRPDILYLGLDIPVSFELTEICAQDVAGQIAKSVEVGGVSVIWTSDPTEERLLAKLSKTYEGDEPVELLCYWKGRVVSPDSHVEAQIAFTLTNASQVRFRRIWYLGETAIFEFSPSGELLNKTNI